MIKTTAISQQYLKMYDERRRKYMLERFGIARMEFDKVRLMEYGNKGGSYQQIGSQEMDFCNEYEVDYLKILEVVQIEIRKTFIESQNMQIIKVQQMIDNENYDQIKSEQYILDDKLINIHNLVNKIVENCPYCHSNLALHSQNYQRLLINTLEKSLKILTSSILQKNYLPHLLSKFQSYIFLQILISLCHFKSHSSSIITQQSLLVLIEEVSGWQALLNIINQIQEYRYFVYICLSSVLAAPQAFEIVKVGGFDQIIEYLFRECDFILIDNDDIQGEELKQLLGILIDLIKDQSLIKFVNFGLFDKLLEAGFITEAEKVIDRLQKASKKSQKSQILYKAISQKFENYFHF